MVILWVIWITLKPKNRCLCRRLFMLKRSVGTPSAGGTTNIFYGEDLDFCWQLKQFGFSLYFSRSQSHSLPGNFLGELLKTKTLKRLPSHQDQGRPNFHQSHENFYQQNLIEKYPRSLRWIVWLGIDLLEFYRVFKAKHL